ncbi:MAG: sigma-70 family RNA polymerase sigma factor [Aristaeellaceae bacterium]
MTARRDFSAELTRARMNGREAVAALAEEHLPLVAAMVSRFPWYGREREELYQQGCVGLMKAMARYDPSYGTAFSTYAAAMILGEMRMLCRNDAPVHIPRRDRELRSRVRRTERMLTEHLGRDPTVQELASAMRMDAAELMLAMEDITVSSMDALPAGGGHTLAELLPEQDDWLDRLLLRDIVSRLPREDQRLLLMRYRLGKTQAETARAMGMTQVQVSRRESAVKAALRQAWTKE